MQFSKIGVLIPVYNRHRMVLEALGTVLEQSLQPGKVLVVDDGSEDETPECVADWISEHPESNAELLRLPHRGVSNARSAGIEQLKSFPLLAMLDSDDLWPSDFLERAAATLQEDPAAVAASSDRLHERLVGAPKLRSLVGLPHDPVHWMIKYGAGISSCTLFRTGVLLEIDAFKRGIPSGEDSYAFMRAAECGDWRHVPGSPVFFRRGGSTRGEEGQLSEKSPNGLLHWAEIFDDYVRERPSGVSDTQNRRKEALAGRWEFAGRRYHERGDSEKALFCYGRSIRVRPELRHSFKRRLIAWRSRAAKLTASACSTS